MLSREPSKNDSESRMNNVWRTLSNKSSSNAEGSGAGSVMGFLSRSKSSERLANRLTASRPGSAHSAISIQESPHSAFSSLKGKAPAAHLGEESPSLALSSRRPKRRSSLSDLQDLERCASPFDGNSPVPRRSPQRHKLPHIKRFPPAPVDTLLPGYSHRPMSPGKKENIAPGSTSPGPDGTKRLQSGDGARSALHGQQSSAPGATRMPLVERPAVNDNRPDPPPRTTSTTRKMIKSQAAPKVGTLNGSPMRLLTKVDT
jgi:hypothetical protein